MKALRIGFASVYAWRPHVEHLMFLARLAQQAGHQAVFLACDADLPACYTRELRDVRPDWLECVLCRVGGVRSYTGKDVSSIGTLAAGAARLDEARAREWASSSASTLGRFESESDYDSAAFAALRERLVPTVQRAYAAARAWIEREGLDAVCVFNGRIDATRAIFEAARDAGVRAISLERSWFGNGLQLLPEQNSLGLRSVHEMVAQWRDKPLTEAQALQALAPIAARLTATNLTEWRAYNRGATGGDWPLAASRRRLLLLPGSTNEVWGEAAWRSRWRDATAAYDAIIGHLGLEPGDLVLRCHPNWSERIGKTDGSRPEQHYTDWARSRGVHVIASADPASTMGLIARADAVVLANGSAALEAAAMGKQVIATAPSIYQEAGFRTDVSEPARLARLRLHADLPEAQLLPLQRQIRRLALRFCYTMTHRLPQYVQHVRAISSSAYRYPPGADPARFIDLVRTGQLTADDATHATGPEQEDRVLDRMESADWHALVARPGPDVHAAPRIRRRWLLRPADLIREKMPVGDR